MTLGELLLRAVAALGIGSGLALAVHYVRAYRDGGDER